MTTTKTHGTEAKEDPATIEREIRETQNEMSRTVDKLGDQLTVKNLFNALLDKADESGVDAHYLVEGARRNPIALGLIAAGAIWLVSDKDSRFPSISKSKSRETDSDELEFGDRDIHHRDYVSHMSLVEMREGEDPGAYQRRRDIHRANFLMCERKPDEDDHSFRQRLDDVTDKFREKRRAWSDSLSHAGSSTSQSVQQAGASAQRAARRASGRAQELYDSNPLVGGILAAAVGAAVGSTIPISRKEQETLGELGADTRDMVSEQKEQLTAKAMEKKDDLLEKADQSLKSSARSQQGKKDLGSGPGGETLEPARSAEPGQPFIIPSRTR